MGGEYLGRLRRASSAAGCVGDVSKVVAPLCGREYSTSGSMSSETAEAQVQRLVREYAQLPEAAPPLANEVALREQLGIESLSLVSLLLRMADEVGVDLLESGIEIGQARTVGDLVQVARQLARK